MQIGHRFRCYPTREQEHILLQWIGCQRHIYNAKVGEDRYFRTFARKSLQHAGQFAPIDQQYSHFKTELTPWLSNVPSVVLRNGAVLWKQAYSRFFARLGGRPVIQKNQGQQSVWLTSELFALVPVPDPVTGEIVQRLHIGTKKFPVGILQLHAHRPFRAPASIHISVHAGRWHVSFSYDDGVPEPDLADTIAWLRQHRADELKAMTVGLDRGVAVPLAGSNGQEFDFLPIQKKRLDKQERYKKRWQRRQARRDPGSGRWKVAKQKVARYQRYGAEVRRDFAHQTSCALTADPRHQLFVFEALKVKNMTASAKGTAATPGVHVRQKAGLNRSILASAWGQVKACSQYKARRKGKCCIDVPPHHSSQECAACGHTHPDNRKSQSEFVCQRCGNIDNADHNAAKVLARRGIELLLSEVFEVKKKKRVAITKTRVGVECAEPGAEMRPTLVETSVSRKHSNALARRSLKRETAAKSLRL